MDDQKSVFFVFFFCHACFVCPWLFSGIEEGISAISAKIISNTQRPHAIPFNHAAIIAKWPLPAAMAGLSGTLRAQPLFRNLTRPYATWAPPLQL